MLGAYIGVYEILSRRIRMWAIRLNNSRYALADLAPVSFDVYYFKFQNGLFGGLIKQTCGEALCVCVCVDASFN